MKKAVILILIMLFFIQSINITAQKEISIYLNNVRTEVDSPPYISYGRVFVPLRFISDSMGLSCSWDEAARMALISGEGISFRFLPDKSQVFVNGKKEAVSSSIQNGRIMIPLRFVSEKMGAGVSWDSDNYRVDIKTDSSGGTSYTQDEVFWLARIIHAEASGEPFSGMIAVGNVVLNRVRSTSYPNTIYGVIFDKKNGVQFEPTINGSIYNTPSAESINAAKNALSGVNHVGECLFFLNPKTAQSPWIIKNRSYYKTIGNHDFYA